jgi:hypothetical protein
VRDLSQQWVERVSDQQKVDWDKERNLSLILILIVALVSGLLLLFISLGRL